MYLCKICVWLSGPHLAFQLPWEWKSCPFSCSHLLSPWGYITWTGGRWSSCLLPDRRWHLLPAVRPARLPTPPTDQQPFWNDCLDLRCLHLDGGLWGGCASPQPGLCGSTVLQASISFGLGIFPPTEGGARRPLQPGLPLRALPQAHEAPLRSWTHWLPPGSPSRGQAAEAALSASMPYRQIFTWPTLSSFKSLLSCYLPNNSYPTSYLWSKLLNAK